jgi:uncharacterized protein YgfB (UPF0149 family)
VATATGRDFTDRYRIMTTRLAWYFPELDSRLQRTGAVMGAAEAHGLACGLVSADVADRDRIWLSEVLADTELTEAQGVEVREALGGLVRAAAADMAAADLSLALCLPPEDAGPAARAVALRDWCRGFLYGFGSGGARAAATLGTEGREALADLASIAAMQAESASGEDDAGALAEIEEYVRVAALLMREDVTARE